MRWKILWLVVFFCGAGLGAPASGRTDAPVKSITITAKRFSFEPNEITIKKGETVTLVVHSEDVTHGLKIEGLGLRTEVKKGQSAELSFTPDTAGTFEGKCAHFCGKGHGSMRLTVHVVE
jgi:cytochrome c oxidase subunit 2